MRLYEYAFTGDPQEQLQRWGALIDEIGRDELFLHVVTVRPDGLTVLDVCPTEADFQGWINGSDWARVKAALGGQVTVTSLGEVRTAVARDGLVEITRPHAHVH